MSCSDSEGLDFLGLELFQRLEMKQLIRVFSFLARSLSFSLAGVLSSSGGASATYSHFQILMWKIPLVGQQQKNVNEVFDN